MKIAVSCFVFLALTLVLCHQDVRKPGSKRSLGSCEETNNKALANLVGNNKPIRQDTIRISPLCSLDGMTKYRSGNKTTGIFFDPQEFCYVEGFPDLKLTLKLKTEKLLPGGERCVDLPVFHAAFLVQEVDANTYMILNPVNSHWFFTRPLEGCDMFVAKAGSDRRTPIVIHSNLDQYGSDKLRNLQLKGTAVDKMLQYHRGYKLIARVYWAAPPSGGVRQQVDAYFGKYKASHPGIQVIFYDNHPPAAEQKFQFIGHYNEDQYWIFTVKGMKDGKIYGQILIL